MDNYEHFLYEERDNIFPVKYPDLYKFYEEHRKALWFDPELDLSRDAKDFKKLTPDEQDFLGKILAFFHVSDGLVNANIFQKLYAEISLQECRYFYGIQIVIENVHAAVYAKLLHTLITNETKRQIYLDGVEKLNTVKNKVDWIKKHLDSKDSIQTRIVVFAAVEGIFFSASFAAIRWFQMRNILPGLTKSNQFIARDEGLHHTFASLLYKKYVVNKLLPEEVYTIIEEAVAIEKEFFKQELPNLPGLAAEEMFEYIEVVADTVLTNLGLPKKYNATHKLTFMDSMFLGVKEQMFETHGSSEYVLPGTDDNLEPVSSFD